MWLLGGGKMKRLSFLVLVFAILFAVFFIAPPLLSQQFSPYPLMKMGDVFDILTPLVLLPLYWLCGSCGSLGGGPGNAPLG